MQLNIDLSDIIYDDMGTDFAQLIKDEIDNEIKRYVKAETKKLMKSHHARVLAIAKKRCDRVLIRLAEEEGVG